MSRDRYHDSTESDPYEDAKRYSRREALQLLGILAGTGVAAGTGLGLGKLTADWYRADTQRRLRHESDTVHPLRRIPYTPVHVQEVLRSHEKIHITSEQPTFNRLRNGIFPPEHTWAITGSAEAFHKLGQTFTDNPRALEKLGSKEVINILVPANGVLLSPLDIAFKLAEKFSRLKTVNLTLTDIDTDAYGAIDEYVRRMVTACDNTANFTVVEQMHPEIAAGAKRKIMRFTYQSGSGRTITMVVNFELQMSGSHYCRPESAADADIEVIHDIARIGNRGTFPFHSEIGDLYTLLSDTLPTVTAKSHFCILQQKGCNFSRHRSEDGYINLPGIGVRVASIHGCRYGCGENHLDTDLLRNLCGV